MRYWRNLFFLLIFLVTLIGCESRPTTPPLTQRLEKSKVDIWNSVQYELITDDQIIKTVEPTAKKGSFLVNYRLRIENHGKDSAESFQVNLVEAIPLNFSHASAHQGISRGELAPKKDYVLAGYCIFDNSDDMQAFLDGSSFSIQWVEKDQTNRLMIRFPIEPTQ